MTIQWERFGRLSTLTLDFRHSKKENATIFANANNQVEISASFKILDIDNKNLKLDESELQKVLYLCDYTTGRDIPSELTYGFTEGKYCNPLDYFDSTDVPLDSEVTQVSIYISSTKPITASMIALGIDIPGVGKFDTSENGTETPNAAKGGGVTKKFNFPKYVGIKSIEKIDYSQPANIRVTESELLKLEDGMWWESCFSLAGPYKEHHSGKLHRKIVTFSPGQSVRNNRFVEQEVLHKGVINENVCDKDGKTGWHGTDYPNYNLSPFISSQGPTLPGAVIGRGAGREDYQVNLWFPQTARVSLDGYFFLEDNSYTYRCQGKLKDKDQLVIKPRSDPFMILYKITIPENNCRHLGWGDFQYDFTVNVTDAYGNAGSFKCRFDDGNYFDKPSLQ